MKFQPRFSESISNVPIIPGQMVVTPEGHLYVDDPQSKRLQAYGGVGAEPKTYSELALLKSDGHLVPGKIYRLTDYQCFWKPPYGTDPRGWTNHPTDPINNPPTYNNALVTGFYDTGKNVCFDLLLTAKDDRTFFEDAYCMESFTGATGLQQHLLPDDVIRRTKVLYSFENDFAKFAWAVPEGKGVIYRMVDAFDNDFPYDFWNIEFWRYSPANYAHWYAETGATLFESTQSARARCPEDNPAFPNWNLYGNGSVARSHVNMAFVSATGAPDRYMCCYPTASFANAALAATYTIPRDDIFQFKFFITDTGFHTDGSAAAYVRMPTFEWTQYTSPQANCHNVLLPAFAEGRQILNNVVFQRNSRYGYYAASTNLMIGQTAQNMFVSGHGNVIFANAFDASIEGSNNWIGQCQESQLFGSSTNRIDRLRQTKLYNVSDAFMGGSWDQCHLTFLANESCRLTCLRSSGSQTNRTQHITNCMISIAGTVVFDFRRKSQLAATLSMLQHCNIVLRNAVLGRDTVFSDYLPNNAKNWPTANPKSYVGCTIRQKTPTAGTAVIFHEEEAATLAGAVVWNALVVGDTTLANQTTIPFGTLAGPPGNGGTSVHVIQASASTAQALSAADPNNIYFY